MNNYRKIHRKPPVSGKNPNSMVIFLHGYGADGADLFGLYSIAVYSAHSSAAVYAAQNS